MCSLINKQLLLTAYAYLFIMEQQKEQQGSEALQLQVESRTGNEKDGVGKMQGQPNHSLPKIGDSISIRKVVPRNKYDFCYFPSEELGKYASAIPNGSGSIHVRKGDLVEVIGIPYPYKPPQRQAQQPDAYERVMVRLQDGKVCFARCDFLVKLPEQCPLELERLKNAVVSLKLNVPDSINRLPVQDALSELHQAIAKEAARIPAETKELCHQDPQEAAEVHASKVMYLVLKSGLHKDECKALCKDATSRYKITLPSNIDDLIERQGELVAASGKAVLLGRSR